MKGEEYNPDMSLFPDVESFKNVITPKNNDMKYVGMLDMSNPIPVERIKPYDGTSIDGIRVIFKKNRIIIKFKIHLKITVRYNFCGCCRCCSSFV